jgi:hypothetical protein
MAYKQEPGGGPKMKTGGGIPPVLLQSTDEKKGKKDPKDNVINKQFDLVQSRFPNHTVQRSKRNFGSYQVSSNESMGGSFEYTPGKRVKKLSSNSKSTDK